MNKIIFSLAAAVLIITSSIAVHEVVHILQLSGQSSINEVCLLGYKEAGDTQALGWVKAGTKISYHAAALESTASIVQMAYVGLMSFLLWRRNGKSVEEVKQMPPD